MKKLLAVATAALIMVPAALAFRFTDETRYVPVGKVGVPYEWKIDTAAGCQGVKIQVENGALPEGLRLEGSVRLYEPGSNWKVVGTPTKSGTASFWLRATSEWPECRGDSTEEPFSITVEPGALPPPPPQDTPPPPPAEPAPVYTAFHMREDTRHAVQKWNANPSRGTRGSILLRIAQAKDAARNGAPGWSNAKGEQIEKLLDELLIP